jgi:hypothetical protein
MGRNDYDKKKGVNMKKEMKDIEKDIYESAQDDAEFLRQHMNNVRRDEEKVGTEQGVKVFRDASETFGESVRLRARTKRK